MVALMLATGTLALQAQTRPYYGSWAVNAAKSELRGVTATYKDVGGNRIAISGMGQKDVWVVGTVISRFVSEAERPRHPSSTMGRAVAKRPEA